MEQLATKIYRPEGVSVAHIAAETVADKDHWNRAVKLVVSGNSDFEMLQNRAKLREGLFKVTANKRRGHFVLTAWSLF